MWIWSGMIVISSISTRFHSQMALVCCADNDSQEAGGILTGLYWEGFSIRYDERADEHTVAGSACILAFFSEHTEQSENTMRLLRLAINRDKAKIIQVFLDNSSWPKAVRNDLHDRQAINKGQMSLFAFEGKPRDALRTFGCSLNRPRGFEVVINENNQVTITKFTAKNDFPRIVIPKTFFSPPVEVSEIGEKVFDGCTNLTSITLPEGVTSIGDMTFSQCKRLTSIILPAEVTSIGDGAFSYCNLTSIILPDSVTSIRATTFAYCRKLKSISVDANHPALKDNDGVLFNKTGNILIAYPAGKSETMYTIPEGVTGIGMYAFRGCINLTSITLPDDVTSIGDRAFSECGSLTSITLPNGVTSIGWAMFLDCTNLTFVTLPDGVTSIGDMAFFACLSLTFITLPDSITGIGNGAFSDCPSLVIYCSAGSHAEQYAKKHGIKCGSEPQS
jgi:hypothetical protein